MATYIQRAASIADALINGTATQSQRQRLLAAFGSAEIFVKDVRQLVLSKVVNIESEGPVAAARQAVDTAVSQDFTEIT